MVYAFPFDETSGGGIALFALCERLNAFGETALVWPSNFAARTFPTTWRQFRTAVGSIVRFMRGWKFDTGPFAVPVARRRDLRDAVVVYPEIVDGNPLGAKYVVRWLLHRPGFHTGRVDYGDDDLFFFYQDAFNDPDYNQNPARRLTITWVNPVYEERGATTREGTCYLVRKGRKRVAEFDLRGQLCVDQLSHADKARVFNEFRYLHSLDEYSMYSLYAAICGCIPVIEPVPGLSREEWFPNEVDRYGLAYGWDDVDWAIRTRGLLLRRIATRRRDEDAMVKRFIDTVQLECAGRVDDC